MMHVSMAIGRDISGLGLRTHCNIRPPVLTPPLLPSPTCAISSVVEIILARDLRICGKRHWWEVGAREEGHQSNISRSRNLMKSNVRYVWELCVCGIEERDLFWQGIQPPRGVCIILWILARIFDPSTRQMTSAIRKPPEPPNQKP